MATTTISPLSKSQLFHWFNRARAAGAGLDRTRVNRALSLIQSGKIRLLSDGSAAGGSGDTSYMVNATGCSCPDARFRGNGKNCKHWIAWAILTRAQQNAPQTTPAPAPTISQQEVDDAINLLYGVA